MGRSRVFIILGLGLAVRPGAVQLVFGRGAFDITNCTWSNPFLPKLSRHQGNREEHEKNTRCNYRAQRRRLILRITLYYNLCGNCASQKCFHRRLDNLCVQSKDVVRGAGCCPYWVPVSAVLAVEPKMSFTIMMSELRPS